MSINTIIIITLIIMTVLVVGAFIYVYLRDKNLDDIRCDVYQLFRKAERKYKESDEGPKRMKYVIQQARGLLPSWLQVFITDEFLYMVLQKWFDGVKDLLDDGKLNGIGEQEE